MTISISNLRGVQSEVDALLASHRAHPVHDEHIARNSKIRVEISAPATDLTFDWRRVPGSHSDIVLDIDPAVSASAHTVRLLGYDRRAEILGCDEHWTVYTDDPDRETFPSWDEEITRRPTILITHG